jgi:hypothetical protein
MDKYTEESILKSKFIISKKVIFRVLLVKETSRYAVAVQKGSVHAESGWLDPKVKWQGVGIQKARTEYKKIVAKTEDRALKMYFGIK